MGGSPIPSSYQLYNVDFTASATTTNLSFAFREDPAFIFLSNVSLTTGGGPNLLLNGDFSLGPVDANQPTDWTYLNTFGASFAGYVRSDCGFTAGGNCYFDGAVQAYDGITQSVATTIGDVYDVSFELMDNSGASTFSDLSTNGNVTGTGGNGIDMLVYAGNIPTRANVPEPITLSVFGVGLAGAAAMRRRKKAKA